MKVRGHDIDWEDVLILVLITVSVIALILGGDSACELRIEINDTTTTTVTR